MSKKMIELKGCRSNWNRRIAELKAMGMHNSETRKWCVEQALIVRREIRSLSRTIAIRNECIEEMRYYLKRASECKTLVRWSYIKLAWQQRRFSREYEV